MTARGERGTIFYSTLPLPPAHEHWDIYLQLCMWDDYHVFLIATLVFTRLLLDEIYHLIELPFDWLIDWWWDICLFTWWIDSRFLLWRFDMWETGGFELASTITLALQANRLTCISWVIVKNIYCEVKLLFSVVPKTVLRFFIISWPATLIKQIQSWRLPLNFRAAFFENMNVFCHKTCFW